MTALLEIANLSVNFPVSGGLFDTVIPGRKKYIDILDGISLSLSSGETLGLVGESGSGKTTLARAILGLSPITAGTITFNGAELSSKQSFAAMRRSSAMMFQDPVASLSPRMSVGALLTEPFVIHGVAMQDRKSKAEELLNRVGLSKDMASRYPHELSGGQARRVGVARALALHPKLVIADEPTAGLDVSVQGEILNLMTELKTVIGLSYMIITHNLAMVRHVSDRIAVMYLGRLIEVGPTREVFRKPLHPYAKSLIASEPQPDPRKRRADLAIKGEIPSVLNRPKGCEFHARCAIARERCRSEAPQLRAIESNRLVRCHYAET
jgi:peptide/nickel transport system ATP-binding protein